MGNYVGAAKLGTGTEARYRVANLASKLFLLNLRKSIKMSGGAEPSKKPKPTIFIQNEKRTFFCYMRSVYNSSARLLLLFQKREMLK